jgi:ornithine decarboxylase
MVSFVVLIFLTDYINDGVYGAFNCIIFDHQVVQPYVLSMAASKECSALAMAESKCSVWGPTCDSIDCVCPSAMLPSGLRTGDWLGFENMGAYTVCAASQFNGFEVSKVVYTAGDEGEGAERKNESKEVRRILTAFAEAGEQANGVARATSEATPAAVY